MLDLKKAENLATKVAVKAGNFLRSYQSKVKIEKMKDIQDILTDADLKAEEIIIKTIQSTFPKHNILSEEAGLIDKKSKYTWIVDPLDGTKEYIRNLPQWGTILSLENSTKTILGVCYFSTTNELYQSSQKQPSLFNNQPTKLSTQDQLNKSIIFSHLPTYKTSNDKLKFIWQGLKNIVKASYRLRANANDSWALCWLARGGLEGYWLPDGNLIKWHDLSPGLMIAKQAGAKITDSFGKPIKQGNFSNGIVVSNGLIHQQLLKIINQQK